VSVDAKIDLDALTRERAAPITVQRPARWKRFVVPAILLLAFGGVLAASLGDFLRGALEVDVVRPVPVAGSSAQRSAGQVVAQAAGWVEPDPFAVRVTALAEGVVREMLVQESDLVEAGDPVAQLVDNDARIGHQLAEAMLEEANAEVDAALAELTAAQDSLEASLDMTLAKTRSEAEVKGRQAELEARKRAVAKGQAQVSIAEDELAVQRELEAAGAAGPRQVELAAARLEEARGELGGLEAESALAAAALDVASAELVHAQRNLSLRIEEHLRIQSAQVALATAQAKVAQVRATCDEACLRLDRMVVRAPVRGVVLERLATVGTQLGGESRTVATLYDPSSIRVRVDVPQQDLAQLFVGQHARIESDARPGKPYEGEVSRIVRRADLQKVTLQAHVRVLDGDELLRPEMLTQVRFLAPEKASDGTETSAQGSAVSIPARLLVDGNAVWVLDAEHGTAVRRQVRVGARDGDSAVVEEGLNLSDKLIDARGASLRESQRVRARETSR
jgi:HlyD family secretion protein